MRYARRPHRARRFPWQSAEHGSRAERGVLDTFPRRPGAVGYRGQLRFPRSLVRRGLSLLFWGGRSGGLGENLDCDTRSHVVSELVKEVWLMPGT